MVSTVEVAFAVGSLLALVVAFLEGWTTGHVSGQWIHDSVNRESERFNIGWATKSRAMVLNALAAAAIFLVAGAAGAGSLVSLLTQLDVISSDDIAGFGEYQWLSASVAIVGMVVAAAAAAYRTRVVLDAPPVPSRLS